MPDCGSAAAYCKLITVSLFTTGIAAVTWLAAGSARIAARADLFRTDRLINGKNKGYAACLTAGASYASCLRSWGRISITDGSNKVQAVAGQREDRGITAGDLSACNSLAAFVSYLNVKIFFLAGAYCKKLFHSNCKTAFSVGYVSQLYSVLSHGRISGRVYTKP